MERGIKRLDKNYRFSRFRMKPLIIIDDIYLQHYTIDHPESISRLVAIYKKLNKFGDKIDILSSIEASKEQILTVHTIKHYNRVEEASKNSDYLDMDTPTSKDSFIAAKYAVGAGIKALNLINLGKYRLAFCLVRPPGHHATPNKSMGFCLFNNIAISAKYAQSIGYKRVFIIDFDVHHGNGTQDTFYSDSSVFYFSTHQAFTYPGSGDPSETGAKDAKGYTFNYPLMPNSTDKELIEAYREELPPLIKTFNPDIILISAGYDLHESDPLAMLDITFNGIKKMMNIILSQNPNIPKILFLEGGYNIDALAINIENSIDSMIDASKISTL